MEHKNMEPENLYPDYRKITTKQIAKLTNTGESFKLVAPSGQGKSKYLRYIATSPILAKKIFKNISFIYLDLNRIYKNNTDYLIKILCKELKCKENSASALEDNIKKQLTQKQRLYIIIDHCENLNDFPKYTALFLRSLRDTFKYKLGFILSHESETKLDIKNLKQLLEITSFEIELPNLTDEEVKKSIDIHRENLNVKISKDEENRIVEFAKGNPRLLKHVLTQRLGGITIEKAIININQLNIDTNNKNNYFLDIAAKNMTKSEYLFFTELYNNKESVVERDDLALLISPESQGAGVSNEAIDQIISRVRKAIKDLNLPLSIKTKRGIGYYLEE